MRIGIGYDIHRLIEGRDLFLGGIKIDYPKGLDGDSDADVVIHSIIDAILGAMGEGDIGGKFGVGDPKYLGISSLILLKEVFKDMKKNNFRINNVDVTVVCERPKLSGYILDMKKNIAEVLQVNPSKINIKSTTAKGIGSIGSGEAIASHAVVSLFEGQNERGLG